jgi:hypothetical protein
MYDNFVEEFIKGGEIYQNNWEVDDDVYLEYYSGKGFHILLLSTCPT